MGAKKKIVAEALRAKLSRAMNEQKRLALIDTKMRDIDETQQRGIIIITPRNGEHYYNYVADVLVNRFGCRKLYILHLQLNIQWILTMGTFKLIILNEFI